MPHAGLLDESRHGPEEAELIRARLHYRSGKRRLSQGYVHEGISTLYDALLSGLRWYVASPGRLAGLDLEQGDDLNDEKAICTVLKRSGVLDSGFDYDALCGMVERGLDGDMAGVDKNAVEDSIDAVLEALGVTPFDASRLPPEPPGAV